MNNAVMNQGPQTVTGETPIRFRPIIGPDLGESNLAFLSLLVDNVSGSQHSWEKRHLMFEEFFVNESFRGIVVVVGTPRVFEKY